MIECTKFKEYVRGTLRGFADFSLPKMGINIYGCALHEKADKRWVTLPAKEYENENGEKKFMPFLRFHDTVHYHQFVEQGLEAIDKKITLDKHNDGNINEEVPF